MNFNYNNLQTIYLRDIIEVNIQRGGIMPVSIKSLINKKEEQKGVFIK